MELKVLAGNWIFCGEAIIILDNNASWYLLECLKQISPTTQNGTACLQAMKYKRHRFQQSVRTWEGSANKGGTLVKRERRWIRYLMSGIPSDTTGPTTEGRNRGLSINEGPVGIRY